MGVYTILVSTPPNKLMSPRSALALALLAACGLTVPASAGFKDHIGLQLYSLREMFKTDPMAALDQAKAFGVTEVEAAGTAGLTAQEFRAALDARGLKAVSDHVQYGDMEKDLDAVVQTVKTLGAQYAVCPWIPHEGALDGPTVKQAAANFNKWGAAFRAAGIKFGYHTHGYEFIPGDKPGTTRFDELVAATDPKNVCLQLDVYWAYVGGADPAQLLEKYGSRWFSLHVKGVRPGLKREPGRSETKPEDRVVVGQGELDWKALISAAQKAGVKYYFIEDETPDPLKNIPPSIAYLRQLKLRPGA